MLMAVPPFLDVVRIEPAGTCNLKCIHCPTSTAVYKKGIMSEDTFNVIVWNIKSHVPRVVVMYHGGEPLLCKDVWDWVGKLKAMGVGYVKTVTNGMLLNKYVANQMLLCGLDEVEVSIDGNSPSENDAIRLGSDYSQIISNVKRLLGLRNQAGSALPKVIVTNVQLSNDRNAGVPQVPRFLMEAFTDNAVDFKSTYAIRWPNWKVVDGCVRLPSQARRGYCSFLYETITIRWNGDVVPCCYDILGEYVVGNVNSASLTDIWEGDLYDNIRRGLRNRHPVRICRGCCSGY